MAFHINKDMINLLNFKREKIATYQSVIKFLRAKKNARMPISIRAKMVTN
tara:strand:- start:232 stop:381 length:150 start_codon:yes stop_codon:yes gene_type:complete